MKPKNLGKLLDHLRNKRPLTTFEVSRICGVVHGTISKWIDEGKLAAFRTPGGHRRVRINDLQVFLKIYNILVPMEMEKMVQDIPQEEEKPGTPPRIIVLEEDGAISETVVKFLKEAYPNFKVTPIHIAKPVDLHKMKEAIRKLLIFAVLLLANVPSWAQLSLLSVTPRKIFTPNGDGINDTLIIRVQTGASDVRGRIFDVKGNVVSELRALTANSFSWDGRDNDGNPAPKGIYIYQIETPEEALRGTVVLVR